MVRVLAALVILSAGCLPDPNRLGRTDSAKGRAAYGAERRADYTSDQAASAIVVLVFSVLEVPKLDSAEVGGARFKSFDKKLAGRVAAELAQVYRDPDRGIPGDAVQSVAVYDAKGQTLIGLEFYDRRELKYLLSKGSSEATLALYDWAVKEAVRKYGKQ